MTDKSSSIHDSAGSDDIGTTSDGKYTWAGMWRSIILSSIGVTAYPYCLWLKSLALGDLEQLLTDVATNRTLRPKFFEGPMEVFEMTSGPTKIGRLILDWQKIIEKVGDCITKYAKEASENENKVLQLTNLEGGNLPTSLLSVWVSRLPTLTALRVRDGSVLTEEVAHSLREHCPAFKDLTCYTLLGSTVDENMSAFFRALRPNTLENFSILSSNVIEHDAIEGLMQHSESLQTLTLSSLQKTSLPFLHLLSSCPYIESLQIDSIKSTSSSTLATNDNVDDKDTLVEFFAWLKGCRHLKKLNIKSIGGASKLLADALKSPNLRLTELEAHLLDDDEAFYAALGYQAELESLTLRWGTDIVDQNNVRHDTFMDSICSCKKLQDLNIMLVDHLPLTPDDLAQIKESIPGLESISFDGEWLTDAIWESLSEMPSLTTINLSGLSRFSFDGIMSFIKKVKASGSRDGFRLYVMNQQSEAKIAPEQVDVLSNMAAQIPGGAFEFLYWRDPFETESNLSD